MFSWERDDFDENGKLIVLYRYQRIIDEDVIKKGKRVLDIGGWGKLEYRLCQEECNVCTFDIDINLCKSVKKRYGTSFDIVNGDAYRLPFKERSFDIITCFEVFEHLKLDSRPQIIKEISRTLKNHGYFIGTIPIPGYCHAKDDPTVNFLTSEEFIILISSHFTNITIEKTGSISKNDIPSSWYFKTINI